MNTESVEAVTELPKCVLVVADDLPPGLTANAVAVLAATLGQRLPALIGPDLPDADGQHHAGLVSVPLPVLKADRPALSALRARAIEIEGLLAVDVTETAQSAHTYPDYARALAETPASALVYVGIALCGPKKQIAKMTGSLPLLR